MIYNSVIYASSIYDPSVYIDFINKPQNGDAAPVPDPQPQPDNPPSETITYKKLEYLKTAFMIMQRDADRSNIETPGAFNISNITAISMIIGGAGVQGDLIASNFVKGRADVDFTSVNKQKLNFWVVAFQNDATKAVQVEIRINRQGVSIRTMTAKEIPGNFVFGNFANAQYGNEINLAMSDAEEGIGVKNAIITLTE